MRMPGAPAPPRATRTRPRPGRRSRPRDFAAPSNPPETTAATSAPAATPATTSATPPAAAPTNPTPGGLPPENPSVSAAPPSAGGSEYKIVRGDTLSKIAHKFHVGLAALKAANPGVDSTKLKVEQTIHVPAPTAAAAAPSGAGAAPGAMSEGAGGQPVYTVKSGDTLTKIARESGVKVKALREANNLKTNKIRVGQKLKLPPQDGRVVEAAPAP